MCLVVIVFFFFLLLLFFNYCRYCFSIRWDLCMYIIQRLIRKTFEKFCKRFVLILVAGTQTLLICSIESNIFEGHLPLGNYSWKVLMLLLLLYWQREKRVDDKHYIDNQARSTIMHSIVVPFACYASFQFWLQFSLCCVFLFHHHQAKVTFRKDQHQSALGIQTLTAKLTNKWDLCVSDMLFVCILLNWGIKH